MTKFFSSPPLPSTDSLIVCLFFILSAHLPHFIKVCFYAVFQVKRHGVQFIQQLCWVACMHLTHIGKSWQYDKTTKSFTMKYQHRARHWERTRKRRTNNTYTPSRQSKTMHTRHTYSTNVHPISIWYGGPTVEINLHWIHFFCLVYLSVRIWIWSYILSSTKRNGSNAIGVGDWSFVMRL